MQQAVVKIGSQQYRVSEGDEILVSRLKDKEESVLDINDVILLTDGEKIALGRPFVTKALVKVRVIKHLLGEKLFISKFKAKTGYRRKTGFRSRLTQLKIEKIVS